MNTGIPNVGMPKLTKAQEEQYASLFQLLERENVQTPTDLKKLYERLAKQVETTKTYDEKGKPIIDDEGGCIITPSPGFVIKTKVYEFELQDKHGGKAFINMCEHELVDAIEEKALPETEDIGIRIPLSLGEVREDFDKKGGPCRVYDIIWNPSTVKKALEDKDVRQMMIQLAFAHIKQKKGVELSEKYIIPKMKYKGKTVQLQRIKGKKAPKIEEIKSQTKFFEKTMEK